MLYISFLSVSVKLSKDNMDDGRVCLYHQLEKALAAFISFNLLQRGKTERNRPTKRNCDLYLFCIDDGAPVKVERGTPQHVSVRLYFVIHPVIETHTKV